MKYLALILLLSSACAPSTPAVCGNGEVEEGEGCDDGNTIHFDACDRNCQVPDCLIPWYQDLDEDGIGGEQVELSCNGQRQLIDVGGDCDDEDASLAQQKTWWADEDGDGLGDPNSGEEHCEPPVGFVLNELDSDDGQHDASGCWSDVAIGRNHSCGLTSSGAIRCWGQEADGRLVTPAGNDFASITAGYNHTCALRQNGSAVCWGKSANGVTQPPALTFSQLDCGLDFCCGVSGSGLGNGRCFGRNDQGQAQPPTDQEFVKMSSSDSFHACGLTTENSIVCWGKGDASSNLSPIGAPARMLFSELSTGSYSCGVTFSGKLHCWGLPSDLPEGDFYSVDVTTAHACGLQANRQIACWGTDTYNRTANPEGGLWQKVETSQLHSCALNYQGELSCWGYEEFGKLVVPSCP